MNHFRLLLLTTISLCVLFLGACASKQATSPDSACAPLPTLFGAQNAQSTLIVYTNPQCPPCRKSWPLIPELAKKLGHDGVRIHVLGQGFSESGTHILYITALLSEQSPALASQFLTQAMADAKAPADQEWSIRWINAHAQHIDMPALERALASHEKAESYLASVYTLKKQYAISHTPTLIVNGRVYDGPHTVKALQRALR